MTIIFYDDSGAFVLDLTQPLPLKPQKFKDDEYYLPFILIHYHYFLINFGSVLVSQSVQFVLTW